VRLGSAGERVAKELTALKVLTTAGVIRRPRKMRAAKSLARVSGPAMSS